MRLWKVKYSGSDESVARFYAHCYPQFSVFESEDKNNSYKYRNVHICASKSIDRH